MKQPNQNALQTLHLLMKEKIVHIDKSRVFQVIHYGWFASLMIEHCIFSVQFIGGSDLEFFKVPFYNCVPQLLIKQNSWSEAFMWD